MARARIGLGALALGLVLAGPAAATSGWGCYRVVGVGAADVLNVRVGPAADATLAGTISPLDHGIIALDDATRPLETEAEAVSAEAALCVPAGAPMPTRWCHVTHFTGGGTTTGWVNRRFLNRSECP